MTAFPDVLTSVSPQHPFHEEVIFNNMHSEFEGANIIVKQKWTYPRRIINLNYMITPADALTLYAFYIARAGSYGSFAFFFPYSSSYVKEYVGVGNGTKTCVIPINYNMQDSFPVLTEGYCQK